MTGSNIEFGHAEGALKQIAERVIQAKQEFNTQSNTLDSQIGNMRGKWDGAGGQAFTTLHQAWTEKHKTIVTALDKFHAALTETESDNIAVDQAAGDGVNSLMNRLGSI